MKNDPSIESLLDEFEAAVGKEFEFVGNMKKYNGRWNGEIKSVDRNNCMINGEHGEFPINCVAIKKDKQPSIKELQQRKSTIMQGNLFT